MRYISTILIISISLFSALSTSAQADVDVKLQYKHASDEHVCLGIEVRSARSRDISLAGQNYRIFYDAKKLSVRGDDIISRLDQDAYSDMDILTHEEDQIGFLSISVDGVNHISKTELLSATGEWREVSSVCFDRLSDRDFDLVWADESTESYASAEVALSEWIDDEDQIALRVNKLIGYSSAQQAEEQWDIAMEVYPNPVIEYLNVTIPAETEKGILTIRDAIGREMVYERIGSGSRQQHTYDFTNWPSGYYLIEVSTTSGIVYSHRVVKVDGAK